MGLKVLMNISKLSKLNLEGLLTLVKLTVKVAPQILSNYSIYCSMEHHGLMCSWHSTNMYEKPILIIFPVFGIKEIQR